MTETAARVYDVRNLRNPECMICAGLNSVYNTGQAHSDIRTVPLFAALYVMSINTGAPTSMQTPHTKGSATDIIGMNGTITTRYKAFIMTVQIPIVTSSFALSF